MAWLDFFSEQKNPKWDFIETYEAGFEKKIPGLRPISQLSFVVLDTETTGLDHKKDDILSFGAVKVKGYRFSLVDSLELYLESSIQNPEAIQVHEILQQRNTVPQEVFARKFLEFVGQDILVGHHVGFDWAMLEKACKPFGLKKLLNPVLDTHQLAIRLEKGPHFDSSMGIPGEYTLDNLCERYGIALDDRHTAAGDAFLTAQLLMKLLKKAEGKGIKDFASLMR